MKCKCKCGCDKWEDKELMVRVPAGRFINFDHLMTFTKQKQIKANERKAAKARAEQKEKEKQERKIHRERKIAVKNIVWFRKRAKRTFQDWRRISLILEFLERGEMPRCFTCGTTVTRSWQAGHYMPAGVNSIIMFDLVNVQLQCQSCNQAKSGNLIPYRTALVNKYGESEALRLENSKQVKKWTREEFTEIHEKYSPLLSEVKRNARVYKAIY